MSGMFMDDGWAGGVQVSTVAEVAGLSIPQLRRLHSGGWLVPSHTDRRTGHRRYSRADVDAARLIAALIRTGMPASKAGRVVAEGDRSAGLRHVSDVEAALDAVRSLLPTEGRAWVREVELQEQLVLRSQLPADVPDAVEALGAWQARVAAKLGVGVDALPQAERPPDVPTGAAVLRWRASRDDDSVQGDSVRLEIPWDARPVPEGEHVDWVRSTAALVCEVGEHVSVDQAHAWLDEVVDRDGRLEWSRRAELMTPGVMSPGLVCGAVAALVIRA